MRLVLETTHETGERGGVREITDCALPEGQVQRMAGELLLEVRNRGYALQTQPSAPATQITQQQQQKRTPPSLMRSGSTPHSSRTASSSALNQKSSKLPSHQSAAREMDTSSAFGERIAANADCRCAVSAAAIASTSWSGTMRIDTRAVTVEGITVVSGERQRCGSGSVRKWEEDEARTGGSGYFDVVDRQRGLAPFGGEGGGGRLDDAGEHLVHLAFVVGERADSVVCGRLRSRTSKEVVKAYRNQAG